MSYWRANQDALIDAGVGPDDAEPLMDPRDARYDYPYTLEQAKEHALWEVGNDPPSTVQALLDRMVHHCWTDDDLNRRAVLYLLDDGLLVIDREQRRGRIRLA
jgi:hypothetical protein